MTVNIFWFRRDLRLDDNLGLYRALNSGFQVLPVFIFDTAILSKLSVDDRRVSFIHYHVSKLNQLLLNIGSKLIVRSGDSFEVIKDIAESIELNAVYTNSDFDPYSVERDNKVERYLNEKGIQFQNSFVDHLIFKPGEVLRPDGKPYEIYTPFSKRWFTLYSTTPSIQYQSERLTEHFVKFNSDEGIKIINSVSSSLDTMDDIPDLVDLGFEPSKGKTINSEFSFNDQFFQKVSEYSTTRDFPELDSTTRIGPHLRFGTVSIRKCAEIAIRLNHTWLTELIWREFFSHILAFYPHVVDKSFKRKYDNIRWINDESLFDKWRSGMTGYPLVDAGMRELKQTGFMHNRVRMTAASFLVKHLLNDWRWGEAWFATLLLDYELASNNGNWQWVAGCGCDAAPYFRIFNPKRQQEKFDPEFKYIKRWVPEFETPDYPAPVIDHKIARERCIKAFKKALF